MRLLHYSKEPFVFDASRQYAAREHRKYYKPTGLWVSVEGDSDWRAWCEGEQWGLENLRHATAITLAETAKVLCIASLSALDSFTNEFRREDHDWPTQLDPMFDCNLIDWPRIQKEYDAIIIAPYQHHRRFELMWYYGWDCASGCLWNLGAIANVGASEPVVLVEVTA